MSSAVRHRKTAVPTALRSNNDEGHAEDIQEESDEGVVVGTVSDPKRVLLESLFSGLSKCETFESTYKSLLP